MNLKARELGLADTHFVNPHGLDAPGHVSSARDVVTLAARRARESGDPALRGHRAAPSSRGTATVETTDDLLSRFPPLVAGKTGHTDGAGWSEVAAARSGTVTVYASVLGEPTRGAAQRRPAGAARLGSRPVPGRPRDRHGPRLRDGARTVRAAVRAARRGALGRPAAARRRAARRAGRRADRCRAPGPQGRAARRRPRSTSTAGWWRSAPLVAARSERASGGPRPHPVVRDTYAPSSGLARLVRSRS